MNGYQNLLKMKRSHTIFLFCFILYFPPFVVLWQNKFVSSVFHHRIPEIKTHKSLDVTKLQNKMHCGVKGDGVTSRHPPPPVCPSLNRPFYIYVLSCLAFKWKWGWRWLYFDVNDAVLILISSNLYKKTSEVSIKTRSPPASLSFKAPPPSHLQSFTWTVLKERLTEFRNLTSLFWRLGGELAQHNIINTFRF